MSVDWKCPECGLDYETISPKDAIQALRSYPRRYRAVFRGLEDEDGDPYTVIRRRPDPKTWSALEYAAHVADAFDEMDSIFRRMLTQDDPRLPDSWDPDERAADQRYNDKDLGAVLDQLQANAERAAATLEGVSADDWKRTAQFDYGPRDLLDQARNAVHEGYHHLRDVERVLRAVVGRPVAVDDDSD